MIKETIMAEKKQTYSEAIEELNAILKQLENNEVPLEELLPLVKKASALIQSCQKQLFEVDEEIQKLMKELEA